MKRSTRAETERVHSWMPFWFGNTFIRRQASKRRRLYDKRQLKLERNEDAQAAYQTRQRARHYETCRRKWMKPTYVSKPSSERSRPL